MSDDTPIRLKVLFGHIQLYTLPSRWEGNVEIPRGRTVAIDGDGNVERDESYDLPVRIIHPLPDYPSWCCQKCGEEIGWIGRFLLPFLHRCDVHAKDSCK